MIKNVNIALLSISLCLLLVSCTGSNQIAANNSCTPESSSVYESIQITSPTPEQPTTDPSAVQDETIQFVDYMDIVDDVSAYENTFVRIAGKIEAVGTNKATWHKFFYFRSPVDNTAVISISLKGCPEEMQELCVEGDYVIVTGKVEKGIGGPSLSNCNIEVVGEDAKAIANDYLLDWQASYSEKRQEFIESCSTYTYDTLSRYPDGYIGVPLEVSGSVIQVDIVYGVNMVLLDVGSGNCFR